MDRTYNRLISAPENYNKLLAFFQKKYGRGPTTTEEGVLRSVIENVNLTPFKNGPIKEALKHVCKTFVEQLDDLQQRSAEPADIHQFEMSAIGYRDGEFPGSHMFNDFKSQDPTSRRGTYELIGGSGFNRLDSSANDFREIASADYKQNILTDSAIGIDFEKLCNIEFSEGDVQMRMLSELKSLTTQIKTIYENFSGVISPEVVREFLGTGKRPTRMMQVQLDSFNRDLGTDGTREFLWVLSTVGLSNPGTVTTRVGMSFQNVHSIEIPQFNLFVDPNQNFISNQLAVGFNKLFAQAIMTANNYPTHMNYVISVDDPAVTYRKKSLPLVSERLRSGMFRFPTPLTLLDQVNLTFFNPINPVIFPVDRAFYSATIPSNPGLYVNDGNYPTFNIQVGNPTQITLSVTNCPLQTGSRVYFTNMNYTSMSSVNLNDVEGYAITTSNNYQFTINYDSTTTTFLSSPNGVVMFGAVRMILLLNIEFETNLDTENSSFR